MRTQGFALMLLILGSTLPAQSGFGGFGRSGGPQGAEAVATAEVGERVFTTSVAGRLHPSNRVIHTVPVAGLVSAVHVGVGDRVETGDPLFTVNRDDATGTYAPATVRARVAGSVAEVTLLLNSEIRAGETGIAIIETDRYLMSALISDKDALSVDVGSSVMGTTPNGATIRGVLTARTPEPDYETGLFTLSFRFLPNPSVYAGQFVTVELPIERLRAIFVPQNLLFRRYGSYYLWVVDEEDRLRSREVTVGRSHGDDVQIVQGLQPGERILARRRGNEREGTSVGGSEE